MNFQWEFMASQRNNLTLRAQRNLHNRNAWCHRGMHEILNSTTKIVLCRESNYIFYFIFLIWWQTSEANIVILSFPWKIFIQKPKKKIARDNLSFTCNAPLAFWHAFDSLAQLFFPRQFCIFFFFFVNFNMDFGTHTLEGRKKNWNWNAIEQINVAHNWKHWTSLKLIPRNQSASSICYFAQISSFISTSFLCVDFWFEVSVRINVVAPLTTRFSSDKSTPLKNFLWESISIHAKMFDRNIHTYKSVMQ